MAKGGDARHIDVLRVEHRARFRAATVEQSKLPVAARATALRPGLMLLDRP